MEWGRESLSVLGTKAIRKQNALPENVKWCGGKYVIHPTDIGTYVLNVLYRGELTVWSPCTPCFDLVVGDCLVDGWRKGGMNKGWLDGRKEG